MKLLGNTIINKEERKKQSTEKKYILNRDSECEYDGNRSEQAQITCYLMYCIAIAVISSFNYGYNIGMYNTPWKVVKEFCNEVYLERYHAPIDDKSFTTILSIINGLLPLGGIFGSIFSGYFADKFGRKGGLMLTNFILIVGSIMCGGSKYLRSYEILMFGRFLSGVYCGIITGILPLYLNELPPQHLRGRFGTLNQLTIFLGTLVANVLGLPNLLGNRSLWMVLVSLNIITATIQLVGLSFAAESPKYLFNANKIEKSISTLKKLRGKQNEEAVKAELQELVDMAIDIAKKPQLSWMDFLSVKYLKWPLFISVFIKFAQFFSGINAVAFYSTEIFYNAGIDGVWSKYATILLGIVQVLMTLICMILIEKIGRRKLIFSSCIGMCIFSFLIASSRIYACAERAYLYIVTVTAAIGYLIFYAIGLGPVSWVIVAELFDSHSSGKANCVISFFSWSFNFFITVSFPFLEIMIRGYSFYVYAVLLIFISIFIFLIVPETKDRSNKEISSSFNAIDGVCNLFQMRNVYLYYK